MTISLDSVGEFTWGFGTNFLIEIGTERYVWSSPDYNGDNTIKPYKGNPRNFTSDGFCGRDKGTHIIREYCGNDVRFVDC